jgi:hypothetical protein
VFIIVVLMFAEWGPLEPEVTPNRGRAVEFDEWVHVSENYLAATVIGAPLSFTKNATNFAGLVLLAFRPTAWISSGTS